MQRGRGNVTLCAAHDEKSIDGELLLPTHTSPALATQSTLRRARATPCARCRGAGSERRPGGATRARAVHKLP